MKDSGIEWIGEIPEGWETCLYKYCCSVQPGYPFDSAKFSNSSTDGFPLIRIRDITSGEIQTYYTGEYPPNYIVTAGDLLVGMDGDFNVRWWNNDAALLNQRCCRVTEKDSVLRRFLYYVLPFTLQHINTLTYATTVKHLANGDILNSFIAFPSLPAQQNIIHYLDTVCSEIDAMLSKTRSSIEEYKKLKQAVITQAVTKGVRGEREMKDSGVEWIGEIPKEWSVSPMKHFIDILPGYAFSSDDFCIEEGIPLLRGINVGVNEIRWDETVRWNHSISKQLESFFLKENDLVVGLDRPWISDGTRVAFIAKKDLPCLLLQRVCRIRTRCNFDIRLIYYWLSGASFKDSLSTETTGISVPHISTKQIEQFIVAFPNLLEQTQVCNYLDAKCAEIDGLIAKRSSWQKSWKAIRKV